MKKLLFVVGVLFVLAGFPFLLEAGLMSDLAGHEWQYISAKSAQITSVLCFGFGFLLIALVEIIRQMEKISQPCICAETEIRTEGLSK